MKTMRKLLIILTKIVKATNDTTKNELLNPEQQIHLTIRIKKNQEKSINH